MRRGRKLLARVAASLAVSVVVASGCSLVLDTEGYPGVRPDDASVSSDTAPDPGDGGDASRADDARDADGGGPASPRCVPDAHAFCADFDQGPPNLGWTETAGGLGTFSLATDAHTTPPASLGLAIAWDASAAAVALRHTQTVPVMAVRCRVDVRRDGTGGGRLTLGALSLERPGYGRFTVSIEETESAFDRRVSHYEAFPDGGDRRGILSASFPGQGIWHRVGFEVSLAASTFGISIDGTTSAQGMLADAGPATSWTFQLGPGDVSGMSGPWGVRYDSLVCDVDPP
jgi:hypothetical protein